MKDINTRVLELCAAATANPEPDKLLPILDELRALLRESDLRAANLTIDPKKTLASIPVEFDESSPL